MPLYEYRCSKCDRVFELLQKFSDAPLEVHEGCGGPVERLISAPSFQFKGSGWYVTDYKNATPKTGANGAEAKGPDAKGPDAKGDAKPAEAKADSKESASAASETKTESKPAAEAAKK